MLLFLSKPVCTVTGIICINRFPIYLQFASTSKGEHLTWRR